MAEWKRWGTRLTGQAFEGWDQKCTDSGITATALIEALGLMLEEGDDWVPAEAVRRAKLIDRARRSRR